MTTLRLAAACALWLVPAGATTVRRIPRWVAPGALALAASVTAGVLADELTARRDLVHGDRMTESCIAAWRAVRAVENDELAARRTAAGERAARLAGCPA